MRCSRCGNENPETNRFCGMCGSSLRAAPDQPVAQAASAPAKPAVEAPREASAAETAATASRAQARAPAEIPRISGPSFLGLNEPGPAPSRRGSSLQRGSHLDRSAGSLDYLLEDDEESKSGGAGKVFLILVALALVVGLGYLRWRHEGISALMSAPKKPTPAEQQNIDSGQGSSSTVPSSATDAASGANPAPSATAPQPTAPAGGDAAAAPTAGSANSSTTPAASSDTASGAGNAAAATPTATAPAVASTPSGATQDESGGAAGTGGTGSPNSNTTPAAPVPKPAERVRAPKPTPVRDPVSDAEKYIYARGGVLQDCDRGLRGLRPAADQGNVRAMISLGALYSTGVCTPKDLPTAYRWFALALRKQPDNQPLQENLQRLWGQMTQPERQLAIKLSQ